jgi:hypothetical protein
VIPPVDKEREDEIGSLDRPEWFKWYYTSWAESTALMDAEQRGWYFNLLMYAASQGDPPGYLPSDEEQLKDIAGFTTVPKEVIDLLAKEVNSTAIGNAIATLYGSEALRVSRNDKWLRVRKKWRRSSTHDDLLYNPRLIETLREAYEATKNARRAGRAGADARWGRKAKERQDVYGGATLLPELQEQADSVAVPYGYDRELDKDTKKEGSKAPSKKGKKGETRFDETLFTITPHMMEVLEKKFPEFQAGDFEYMVDKFKNVYHGKYYTSWSRTFYNFVTNQVISYGYRPGDFNWRSTTDKKQPRTGGGERYEPAAEKNARLEREADEYARRLQGSGTGDSEEDEEALPLTADDVREP